MVEKAPRKRKKRGSTIDRDFIGNRKVDPRVFSSVAEHQTDFFNRFHCPAGSLLLLHFMDNEIMEKEIRVQAEHRSQNPLLLLPSLYTGILGP